MTKKIPQNEKNTSKDIKNIDINFHEMEKFNSEICKLKHIAMDKELRNIEINNSKKYEVDDKKHKELMDIIQNLRKDIKENIEDIHEDIKENIKNDYNNLKDKIVLTEKIIGGKIDKLSEFDDSLKGNGNPGIWESIRNLKWKFRITITMLIIMFILVVGGDFRGVTVDKIKKAFGVENKQVENKQVENKQVENK